MKILVLLGTELRHMNTDGDEFRHAGLYFRAKSSSCYALLLITILFNCSSEILFIHGESIPSVNQGWRLPLLKSIQAYELQIS